MSEMWWQETVDFIFCNNTPGAYRVNSRFIILLSTLSIIFGILDVSLTAKLCSQTNVLNLSYIGASIWGSLPIFFTGLLAHHLVNREQYTTKFFPMLSLASALVFAPAIIIISIIDAANIQPVCRNPVNSLAFSIILALLALFEMILILKLLCSIGCSDVSNQNMEDHVIKPRKSYSFFAAKDQFIDSSIPEKPTYKNLDVYANHDNPQVAGITRLPPPGPQTIIIPPSALMTGGQPIWNTSGNQIPNLNPMQPMPVMAHQQPIDKRYFVAFSGPQIVTNMGYESPCPYTISPLAYKSKF